MSQQCKAGVGKLQLSHKEQFSQEMQAVWLPILFMVSSPHFRFPPTSFVLEIPRVVFGRPNQLHTFLECCKTVSQETSFSQLLIS